MPDHQGEVGRYPRTHPEVFVRLIIAFARSGRSVLAIVRSFIDNVPPAV
jgi:hypothetical protein